MFGEWGNFFVFKYACTARAKKMEETSVTFACMARVIREGMAMRKRKWNQLTGAFKADSGFRWQQGCRLCLDISPRQLLQRRECGQFSSFLWHHSHAFSDVSLDLHDHCNLDDA